MCQDIREAYRDHSSAVPGKYCKQEKLLAASKYNDSIDLLLLNKVIFPTKAMYCCLYSTCSSKYQCTEGKMTAEI